MTTVLVTGFGPYEEEAENPSGLIALRLDATEIAGVTIVGRVMPVDTARVADALAGAIDASRPDVVIVVGVTPGRAAVAIERVAINVRDFPIPDNAGSMLVDERIDPDAPAAYFSGLPVKAILAAWRAEGIPSYVSNTAGTFLCNQIFFVARHLAEATGVRAGLVHIPTTPDRAALGATPVPSLPLAVSQQAVRTAARVAATHSGPDLRLGAGATS